MPVSSALIILLFVTSIFAVISVHLFSEDVWNFGEAPISEPFVLELLSPAADTQKGRAAPIFCNLVLVPPACACASRRNAAWFWQATSASPCSACSRSAPAMAGPPTSLGRWLVTRVQARHPPRLSRRLTPVPLQLLRKRSRA